MQSGDQIEPIRFPDVDPSELPPNSNFSMAAGDFLEVYQEPGRSCDFNEPIISCLVWSCDLNKPIISILGWLCDLNDPIISIEYVT